MTIRSSDLALLDAIHTAVVLLDRSGRIRAMNRSAETVLPPDAIGTLFRSHFPPSGRSTLQWTFTPRDEETVIATGIDVTAEERHRSERMSAVGGLVAGVAHEVRNPLFGISATLDAFEARFGDAQFRAYTTALREQLDRINALMHDLVELGRPSPALLVPGSIASVIAGALDSARPLASREGVEVREEVPDALPEVSMSAQRLVQVFHNLLENAIQHSARGQTVAIRAWHDQERDKVAVAVEDRGPGFDPEALGRIFEPFFTLRSGGTGLGLSLVQRIVDDHTGAIVASNREDGGASVTVELRAEAVARFAG